MSKDQTSDIERLFVAADRAAARAERLLKIVMAVLGLVVSGTLWGARLEWITKDHERRIMSAEGDVKGLNHAVSNIEGRLHGLASQVGKMPAKVAAKLEDR